MQDDPASEFWNVFIAIERQLLSENNAEAMDSLLEALHRIDEDLHYYIGHRDDGRDLLLSVEGNYALGHVVESLVHLAPTMPGWRFRPIVDESIFGEERDRERYPPDVNGDVLFRMARGGDLLWRPRPVDFSFVFPSHDDAQRFAAVLGPPAVVSPYEDGWQVESSLELVPTYATITETEQRLDQLARVHGGHVDGWGCLEQGLGERARR